MDSSWNLIADWYRDRSLNDPLKDQFMSLKDQRICIMGAAGQVGSHFLSQCYALGFDPKNIDLNDNLSLGRRENLTPELEPQLDVRSHLDYALEPPRRPDILVFVGGRSSAPHFQTQADVIEEIQSWEAVLRWCVEEKIRLIFASTSSLCKQRPSQENQPVWPGSLYELCKLTMENMAIQQALEADLSVQICRFFSVYGVTESHKGKFGNLYTQLLWHAIDQTPFELWGHPPHFAPGEQTRDIIFAQDVVRALLHLLTLPAPQPVLDNISTLIYNIGRGKPLTVRDMIQHVATVVPTHQKPMIQEVNVPDFINNYVVNTWGDPSKLNHSGYNVLFPDHIENLTFIYQSLQQERQTYWQLLEKIRATTVSCD